ncbi:DEKNAAC102392 [Brettanomyces naardenensis]|uniref:Conserved oligomeric Golgi complex subunit 6 n=1 Tax=Brettanomyces naardenensis TaxID=13370 RepID=A0A448YLM4_BRENA|nr:DEKNAAC102392 [Brettanomyces naardenensis]
MEFVFDADTYAMSMDSKGNNDSSQSSILPIPSAPLKISNFQLHNDLTKRLSNLRIIQTINKGLSTNQKDSIADQQDVSASALAFKYARNTLDLLASSPAVPTSELQESNDLDSRILGNRLSRVLNQNNYDRSLRESLKRIPATEPAERGDVGGSVYRGSANGQLVDRLGHNLPAGDSADSSTDVIPASGFSNTVGNRRKLRGIIEQDILSHHYLSLRGFQPIAEKLTYLKNDMSELNACYVTITDSLNKIITSSSSVRQTLKQEKKQRDLARVKKHLLTSFRSNFTLNQYEEHYLLNGEINEDFFPILERVSKIHDNCDILLAMNNESLGISIMNQMSHTIDLATDRMVSFLKKNLGNSQDAKNVQKALTYIEKNSIEKFNGVVEELIEARSREVVGEFERQLGAAAPADHTSREVASAVGGNSNTNRTLSNFSYDPKRFTSDILAYLHTVIVNELESTQSLFPLDRPSSIQSITNRILDSLSRLLRRAIESTLRQESKPTIVINLYELLDLYTMMYGKLIDSKQSQLISTLELLKGQSRERLFNIVLLKLRQAKIDSEAEEIDEEFLGLPDWVIDFYAEFLGIFNKDLGEEFLGMGNDESNRLCTQIVDEPMKILESQSKKLNMSKRNKLIFEINGIDYIHSKVEVIPRLLEKSKEVNERLEGLVKELSDNEFDRLLRNSGLYDIYNLVNMIFALEDDFFDVSLYEPIKENKLFNVGTFEDANKKLGDFLGTYITSNDVNNVISPTILGEVSVEPSVRFVKFYGKLVEIVRKYLRDEKGKEVDVFSWSGEEVAVILDATNELTRNELASEASDQGGV